MLSISSVNLYEVLVVSLSKPLQSPRPTKYLTNACSYGYYLQLCVNAGLYAAETDQHTMDTTIVQSSHPVLWYLILVNNRRQTEMNARTVNAITIRLHRGP